MLSKKAIWAIVILMGTALVGIMLIQSYWINWSVQLNKQKFDKDVYEAMNEVSERLTRREQDQALEAVMNQGNNNQDGALQGASIRPFSDAKSALEAPFLQLSGRPFEERLDLQAIDVYLEQELHDRGIYLQYYYGVISNETKNFIIRDGHYVFDENLSEVTNTGINRGLENTNYKVDLFKSSENLTAPGALLIFFPQVGKKVWESVWQMLAGSFIFTVLILVCFVYTIQIIVKQKKLSEMKTDFINNMTHEFKTPIATISLASDSITNPNILTNPEKVARFVGIIKQENSRMLNQVEKVLQMAMVEKQEIKLNLVEVNIHHIIQQASVHFSLQVEPKGGVIHLNLNAEQHTVVGDQTHISNLIHNLLDNANKYTPNSPQIVITTRSKPKGIEISVKDNGIGMTKEQIRYIYDRFYRVHTGNLHDVKGFGLGLSYVKSMVEAHQGTIEVRSELGKGSSFIVYLPYERKQGRRTS